jgi:hypothetical protein
LKHIAAFIAKKSIKGNAETRQDLDVGLSRQPRWHGAVVTALKPGGFASLAFARFALVSLAPYEPAWLTARNAFLCDSVFECNGSFAKCKHYFFACRFEGAGSAPAALHSAASGLS